MITKEELQELLEALQYSTAQLNDLADGWSHQELFEPLRDTIERNNQLLQKHNHHPGESP